LHRSFPFDPWIDVMEFPAQAEGVAAPTVTSRGTFVMVRWCQAPAHPAHDGSPAREYPSLGGKQRSNITGLASVDPTATSEG